MNILWLAPYPIRPGEHPAPWLVSLAAELARAGHHLTILTPSPRVSQPQRIRTDLGYQLIILPYKGGIHHLISGFRTQIAAIRDFLRTQAPSYDVIHIHGTEMQLASSLLEKTIRTPYIISIQGIISLYKSKLPQKFSKRYLYWSISSIHEKREIRHSPWFFCRTDWDQHFVRDVNPRASIRVCWEMLRPEFFDYRHPFTGKGILFMGGDNPLKALTLCLQVFAHLVVRHPDLKLHIVGSVQGAAYQHLLHRLDDRPLSRDNVVIHGALDAPGICRLYAECFCLYHPSLIDNSPNSVCEAQVAGLPVVVTRVGGVSSLIDDGRTGLLVRKNDEDGHTAALQRLYQDSGLQRWLSRNSREMARQRHDPATILETTVNTYRTIASAATTPATVAAPFQTLPAMSILRYLLRAMKIAKRDAWAVCTTRYTRLYLRANGAHLGKGCRSNGVPELEMSLQGHFTAGDGLELQNGRHYNMIGRQQRCYFIIGKEAALTIGDHVGLSGTAIVCHQNVSIGDHTCIGMNCVIYDTDFHDLDYRKRAMIPEDYTQVVKRPVRIGKHVFIGAHSTILKGVTIGDGAIVGAGAVVSKNIPAGEIWGGNPAHFLSRVRTDSSGTAVPDNLRSLALAKETR